MVDAASTEPIQAHNLTVAERQALRERSYGGAMREVLAALLDPFQQAFCRWTMPRSNDSARTQALHGAFHLCGHMMLDLDCTYWAFTWERILAWKASMLAHEEDHPPNWRHSWETKWTRVTLTLFFLGVLPYSEEIHRTYHRELAEKWLEPERAREIERAFLATALAMGYKYERQLRKQGASVLLTVLVATGNTDLATLTKADLEEWQAKTGRSKRVARASMTCIQHVLAGMGYLGGEAPRSVDNPGSLSFTWGSTAPDIAHTFARFLADLATIRRLGTVGSYKVALRRFGDWLGTHDSAVTSVGGGCAVATSRPTSRPSRGCSAAITPLSAPSSRWLTWASRSRSRRGCAPSPVSRPSLSGSMPSSSRNGPTGRCSCAAT